MQGRRKKKSICRIHVTGIEKSIEWEGCKRVTKNSVRTLGLFKEIFSLPMRVVVHFKTSDKWGKKKGKTIQKKKNKK